MAALMKSLWGKDLMRAMGWTTRWTMGREGVCEAQWSEKTYWPSPPCLLQIVGSELLLFLQKRYG